MIRNALKSAFREFIHFQKRNQSNFVLTERVDEVFVISINRAEKRNCVNKETAKQLLNAFEAFEKDDASKVAILCGKGGNFCAGYDLSEVVDSQHKQELATIEKAPMGPSLMITNKPTIAAIDGYAVAGGLELALLCDIRVCEETAVLGIFNRRFGVPLIDGGTVRLPKIVGFGRAMDLILTGRKVDAREALAMGLVNSVTEVGTVLGRAMSLAQSLTKFPQQCLKADRRSAYYSTFEARSIQDALQFEYENGVPIIEEESIEGAKKFVLSGIGKHGKFNLHNIDELMEKHNPKLV
ncbi:hypothetical protein B4U79_01724 [Dinothrombium tinctorium]|uniref:Enoyl-CoA hydratase-like protein n=1 Tax=Dinothrombium tinctorium TaxID=1965070 RepID=A0A443QPJ2_9ACAR|nr:hypothetical protein B4U79_16013 [Dinothrombium tinctorium]RWS04935.1 hypothetical protein B4U79_04699 [Dinothrombium tinctorium]RWS08711.1 hypothetical protein B4U79_01724 [Dinothrombium tinctorium]